MPENIIDKLAFVHIQERKLLFTRTRGNTVWYLPGGKREEGESDATALARELHEELGIDLHTNSLHQIGIHEAPAHGKPAGTLVRLACYTGTFNGNPQPCSEIEELGYVDTTVADSLITPGGRWLLDLLYSRGLID